MFSLKSRQDSFRLLFPKDFLVDEIVEKYTKILNKKHGYITTPIDFLNETVQGVQVLGFTDATVNQLQGGRGTYTDYPNRKPQNYFLHTPTEYTYRSEVNPIQLIDKTLNVTFKHTLGYLNYFMLFENFFYQYQRDTKNTDLIPSLFIDIMNERGVVYSRVELIHPLIQSMDMLDFNYTSPVAQSQTFNVVFNYSNIDYQFIENSDTYIDEYTMSDKTILN